MGRKSKGKCETQTKDPEILVKKTPGRKSKYRAEIPPLIPIQDRNLDKEPDKALLQWKPTEKLSDAQIDSLVTIAKEVFKYGEEQSLGMLLWHGYDRVKTLEDLGNYNPPSYKWSETDDILFEEVLAQYGVNFEQLKKAIPRKSRAEFARYYYTKEATIKQDFNLKVEE